MIITPSVRWKSLSNYALFWAHNSQINRIIRIVSKFMPQVKMKQNQESRCRDKNNLPGYTCQSGWSLGHSICCLVVRRSLLWLHCDCFVFGHTFQNWFSVSDKWPMVYFLHCHLQCRNNRPICLNSHHLHFLHSQVPMKGGYSKLCNVFVHESLSVC